MGKIKKLREIKKITARLKKNGRRIVFTNGCFDILHYGHIKYLEKCKSLGDILIVGLNSDSSVRKIKGKGRPITAQGERAAILSSLESVDYVTIFRETTPATLIKAIKPDVLAKGGDWKARDIVGGAYVKKTGGKVTSVPFVKGYSTSKILKRVRAR